MKILDWVKTERSIRFEMSEYTPQDGALIFDSSRGGTYTQCVTLRFNKHISPITYHSDRVSSQRKAMLDFYIDINTSLINVIDLVSVRGFNIGYSTELNYQVNDDFVEPKIDISTWVSKFGLIPHPSSREIKYLYNEYQIDINLLHNRKNIVKLLFGSEINSYNLRPDIMMSIDEYSNLSSITFGKAEKLIKKLKII